MDVKCVLRSLVQVLAQPIVKGLDRQLQGHGTGRDQGIDEAQAGGTIDGEGMTQHRNALAADTVVTQQPGEFFCDLGARNLIDALHDINTLGKDRFRDQGMAPPVADLTEKAFGPRMQLRMVREQVAEDDIGINDMGIGHVALPPTPSHVRCRRAAPAHSGTGCPRGR